jgi:hypothetical protein
VSSSPALYYVADGRVMGIDGRPLAPNVTSPYAMTSVAVARNDSGDLEIAGTFGAPPHARLAVGSASTGLQVAGVQGALSRPTWAPFVDEVWLGDGPSLYRVTDHGVVTAVPISATNNQPVTGDVTAVRFSPDGGRIAFVLRSGQTSQLWVGAVSRAQGPSGQVQVTGAQAISPLGVYLVDVAWNGQLTLFAVGRTIASGVASVYELQVDGSLWASRGTTNLPGPPDSITVAQNQVAWVSASRTIWEQQGSSWVSPGGELRGTNPVYLE